MDHKFITKWLSSSVTFSTADKIGLQFQGAADRFNLDLCKITITNIGIYTTRN